MTDWHKKQLDAEIAFLLENGVEQVSTAEFKRRYDALGFRFDSRDNCRGFGKYLTGPRAGESTPCMTMVPIVKETGRSWAHFQNPPEIYARVRNIRHTIFAVTRDGYIMEV